MVVYKQERPQLQGAKVQTYYNDGNNSPGSGVNQVVQYVSTGPHRQGLFY